MATTLATPPFAEVATMAFADLYLEEIRVGSYSPICSQASGSPGEPLAPL
jgi:hypothetical protein